MKSTKMLSVIITCWLSACLFPNKARSQNNVPPEVASIVTMNLQAGQAKLSSLGYEMCSSSFTSKKQGWFNESTKICVFVKFHKKSNEITEVVLNNDISECEKGLAASRKVWEKYHDGQAPVNEVKLNEERKKLADGGFKVSYWINEPSPGRNAEYWINETKQMTMFIVWEIKDNKWVFTDKTDYKLGQNPAPKK